MSFRNHGTPSAYNKGCRCAECTECNRLRMQRVREQIRQKPVEQWPHGTTVCYASYACRCTLCKEVMVAKRKEKTKVTVAQ